MHCVFVAVFPTSYTCALRADIHLADRLLRPDTVPVRKRGVLIITRLAVMPRLSRLNAFCHTAQTLALSNHCIRTGLWRDARDLLDTIALLLFTHTHGLAQTFEEIF